MGMGPATLQLSAVPENTNFYVVIVRSYNTGAPSAFVLLDDSLMPASMVGIGQQIVTFDRASSYGFASRYFTINKNTSTCVVTTGVTGYNLKNGESNSNVCVPVVIYACS